MTRSSHLVTAPIKPGRLFSLVLTALLLWLLPPDRPLPGECPAHCPAEQVWACLGTTVTPGLWQRAFSSSHYADSVPVHISIPWANKPSRIGADPWVLLTLKPLPLCESLFSLSCGSAHSFPHVFWCILHVFLFCFFFFLPHLQHFCLNVQCMEVPRPGVELELQLPAYTIDSHSNAGSEPRLQPTLQLTAMPDPYPTERGQSSWTPAGFLTCGGTIGAPYSSSLRGTAALVSAHLSTRALLYFCYIFFSYLNVLLPSTLTTLALFTLKWKEWVG